MEKVRPIQTSVGEIHGRNGIYLDEMIQSFGPSTLRFRGEFSQPLCSNAGTKKRWIGYVFTFEHVLVFTCHELDHYNENRLASSFDEVHESEWLRELELSNYRHYILATYDYVYEIAAKGHELELTGNDRD